MLNAPRSLAYTIKHETILFAKFTSFFHHDVYECVWYRGPKKEKKNMELKHAEQSRAHNTYTLAYNRLVLFDARLYGISIYSRCVCVCLYVFACARIAVWR